MKGLILSGGKGTRLRPLTDLDRLEDMLGTDRPILPTFHTSIVGGVDAGSRIDGVAVIGRTAVVKNSVIRGLAIIGPAKIIDSYVGPFTSIGKDVESNKSEIEHSIAPEGSLIHDLDTRVADSLIGRGVKIHRLPLRPLAHRFMLGDNSEVWVQW